MQMRLVTERSKKGAPTSSTTSLLGLGAPAGAMDGT
jgi:hypothetical protein